MKILLDMNLSPLWVNFLHSKGIEALHWSEVGDHKAPDPEIFAWAKENHFVVFTNDLDFGTILAATNANAPSVIQVRTQALLPEDIGDRFIKILIQFQAMLEHGALITFDEAKSKARVLPFRQYKD
jgi:predicted nuclease of predicted toxin-antitoxin system